MRLWTHDHSVAFRICCRKRNPSSLVSFKILRYSWNKENRKGKQVIKNDIFYVSLPSPVISTFCAALCFLSGCLNTKFFSFTRLSPPKTFTLLKLVSPRTQELVVSSYEHGNKHSVLRVRLGMSSPAKGLQSDCSAEIVSSPSPAAFAVSIQIKLLASLKCCAVLSSDVILHYSFPFYLMKQSDRIYRIVQLTFS